MSHSHHLEKHFIHRTGWLRASVLGANDGIISVTSLVMGMAASGASSHTLLITSYLFVIAYVFAYFIYQLTLRLTS